MTKYLFLIGSQTIVNYEILKQMIIITKINIPHRLFKTFFPKLILSASWGPILNQNTKSQPFGQSQIKYASAKFRAQNFADKLAAAKRL